jgi:DGQHR domain-containing protein
MAQYQLRQGEKMNSIYTFKQVRLSHQRGIPIFSMSLTPDELIRFGRISRLHDTTWKTGVQRKLDADHATEIAIAMTNPANLWLDNILIQMAPEGSWIYDPETMCIHVLTDDFYMDVDDGQHRLEALKVVSDTEKAALCSFPAIASYNLTWEQRLALFVQQNERKALDRNMVLQGLQALDTWPDEKKKRAYQVIMMLATDANSPLKDLIRVDEVVRGRSRVKMDGTIITAAGMVGYVVQALGNRSIIHSLDHEKQSDFLIRYLTVATEKVWARQWKDTETYMLQSARGISTLLQLLTKSDSMRFVLVNQDFDDVRLQNALTLARHFDWSRSKNLHRTDKAILADLDHRMSTESKRREHDRSVSRSKKVETDSTEVSKNPDDSQSDED